MKTSTQLTALEEGFRDKPYYCILGFPTIGFGKRIGPQGADLNLYQFKVSRELAMYWIVEDLDIIEQQLLNAFPWFEDLNQVRKDIIMSMCYQLGFSGFCKFKQTIKCIAAGNYRDASAEMLNSLWASEKQTPARAMRHSAAFRCGDYEAVDLYKNIN